MIKHVLLVLTIFLVACTLISVNVSTEIGDSDTIEDVAEDTTSFKMPLIK